MARSEVIIVGIGGRSVLVSGQTLTVAATPQHKYVTWLPSYAIARWGGDSLTKKPF